MTRLSAEEYRRALRRRRPATGSGSATRTSGSGSRRTGPRAATSRSGATRRTSARRMAQWDEASGPSELDVVLTGALVVDPVIGVVKADIGIKDGRIAGIGRAGSPAISDGIDLVIGPHTKSYMAYGLIATPGAVDTARPHDHPRAPAARAVGRRHDVDHGGVRGAAVRDGAGRSPGSRAWPINIGMQAGARATDERPPRRAGRRRRAWGSRSTRTTARTPSSSTTCCATPTRATCR